MTSAAESTPEFPRSIERVSRAMGAGFQEQAPSFSDRNLSDLFKQLNELPPAAEQAFRRFILQSSDKLTNPSENIQERRALLRGVLFTLAFIRFIEDREELQQWFDEPSLIDDGGVAVRPPSSELGGGQSADPLFLAPPDPEPHPDA